MLIGTFNVYHPAPIETNEKTSEEVIDLFVDQIGEKGMFLTESHLRSIGKNKKDLFTQINAGDDSFLKNAIDTYKKALNSSDSLLKIIEGKGVNFAENDTITFLPYGTAFYSPSLKFHHKRLERNIKVRSYDRVLDTDGYEKLTELEFNKKATEFSKAVITSIKKHIAEALVEADLCITSNLLNAIALRHDPHSNYFTEEQNREFSKGLSAQVESFGLYFDENDDEQIIVSDIEPGGSAWLSNEINEGDIFISCRLGTELITNETTTAYDLQTKLDNSAEKKISLVLKKKMASAKPSNW